MMSLVPSTQVLPLLVWTPLMLALCPALGARRVVLGALILGWLLLPQAYFDLPGLPMLTKPAAVAIAAVCCLCAFDLHTLATFRPRWFDLPVLVFCLVPFASSISNGLGAWDGQTPAFDHTARWAVPYLVGRLYGRTPEGRRDIVRVLILGGLVYVPLCLFEIRMSPQLHRMVYGYFPHQFGQTVRWGGWRPTVFLDHGLAVGIFMSAIAVVLVWLAASGVSRTVFGLRTGWCAAVVVVVSVLCKSSGAIVLMLLALAALFAGRLLRTRIPIVALLLFAPIYVTLRAPNLWSGESMVEVARAVEQERGDSLEMRLRSENALVEKALEQPVFGWGGWGRNRVEDDDEGRKVVTDGLWIIVLGKYGAVGLLALLGMLVLAPVRYARTLPVSLYTHPAFAEGPALMAVVALYAADAVFNAFPSPCATLACGTLGSAALALPSDVALLQQRLRRLMAARATPGEVPA